MRHAILGASRGLGRSLSLVICERGKSDASCQLSLALARKIHKLEESLPEVEQLAMDLSRREGLHELALKLKSLEVDCVWYTAGGGPYGEFGQKKWRDHLWALQVSLLSPLELVHLCGEAQYFPHFVFFGSIPVETDPYEPLSASYGIAKVGLDHFVRSQSWASVGTKALPADGTEVRTDAGEDLLEVPNPTNPARARFHLVKLGYMDTDLLPKNAWPRQSPDFALLDPNEVAAELVEWAEGGFPVDAGNHCLEFPNQKVQC